MTRKVAIFIVIIILSLVAVSSFGQLKPNRTPANTSVTLVDPRFYAGLNFGLPRYLDTTAANANLGADSCGTLIYTYTDNKVYMRGCSPKAWIDMLAATGGGPETDPQFDTKFAGKTTTDLAEGDNLYYTAARFNTAFSSKTTTDLSEGTNLYWTSSRFNTAFAAKSTSDLTEGTNLYYTSGRFNTAFASKSTSDLTEGSNLYWTTGRGDARYPQLSGSYTNPSWLVSIPWSKLTSTPTTLSGYSITDAYPLSGNPSGFLTSFSELDPVWLADKPSYLTSAIAAATYSVLAHTHSFASLTSKPTTIAGYGITDAFTQTAADALYSALGHTHTFASLTSKPTTLSGYGITDAQPLDADLTSIAALTTTSFGRGLLTESSASTARTTLGLGTLATQSGTFSGTSSGTNTGDQTVTLTGNVTGSGTGSFATTIAAGVVTNSMVSSSAAINYSKMENYSAYTMKANNTNASAAVSDITYKSFKGLTYAGTVTWTASTTIPSGTPVVRYSWQQIEKDVYYSITCYYPTNGTGVTAVTFTLPTDMPSPYEPTGTGATDDILYPASGFITTNYATQPTIAAIASLKVNTGDTGWEFKLTSSSVSARYAIINGHYTSQ